MKYRPDDAELLDAIAALLEDEVLPAVPAELQHKVRVAANLTRILQRQEGLEGEALGREADGLARLLGRDGPVEELRAELDSRLRRDGDYEPGFERQAWEALVSITRDDLAVAKPGYDSWTGQ